MKVILQKFAFKKEWDIKDLLKRVGLALSILSLTILVFIVVGFALLSKEGGNLDKESQDYVNEVIPKIVGKWNEKELLIHAAPELLEVTSSDELHKLFTFFSTNLGKMEVYEGSQGESKIFYYILTKNPTKNISASYVAKAGFEKAHATITLSLVKRKNKWYIRGFNINSDAFLQNTLN